MSSNSFYKDATNTLEALVGAIHEKRLENMRLQNLPKPPRPHQAPAIQRNRMIPCHARRYGHGSR